MSKNFWYTFVHSMGLLSILAIVLSLIFPDAFQIRFLHMATCIVLPCHVFSFFTYSLQLFSKRLWIRRAIVILFEAIVMTLVIYLFGYLHADRLLSTLGLELLVFVVVSLFAYYVTDKIEERNLKVINQKLSAQTEKSEN